MEGAKITLNEYLDRWIHVAVKLRVREKTWQDYEGMLQRYIRPHLGETVLAAIRPLDLQTTYQKMIERGLSARTVVVRKNLGRQSCGTVFPEIFVMKPTQDIPSSDLTIRW